MLVLGVRSLARLAGLPRSRVRAAMDAGLLETVATDGLRGRVCHYVLVDGDGAEKLDAWCERHVRRVDLAEVDVPRTNGGHRWFYPAQVREAAEAGAFSLTRGYVYPGGDWLRWAAQWMPPGERAAIVSGIVEVAT